MVWVRTVLLCAVTVITASRGSYANDAAPPFTITLGADSAQVKSSSYITIKAELKNTSNHIIAIQEMSPDCDYEVFMWDKKGHSPQQTKRRREVEKAHCLDFDVFRNHLMRLNPGEAETESALISAPEDNESVGLYDLKVPGKYFMQVRHVITPEDFDKGSVKSNIITMTVTE